MIVRHMLLKHLESSKGGLAIMAPIMTSGRLKKLLEIKNNKPSTASQHGKPARQASKATQHAKRQKPLNPLRKYTNPFKYLKMYHSSYGISIRLKTLQLIDHSISMYVLYILTCRHLHRHRIRCIVFRCSVIRP